MSLIDFVLKPLEYAFMIRALIAIVFISSVCALVGTYVILRGMSFFGDALAHSILPGISIGYLLNGDSRQTLFWWALGTAVVSSIGINLISRTTRIKEDTSIGIIFAGMFALGIALISTVRNYAVDLTHFLFGNVLAISTGDLWRIGIFSLAVFFIIILFYKEFLVSSFDPILAQTLRLPVKFFEIVLLILIALAIVVSLQAVGVALMVAMLVTPAATAFLLVKRLPAMMTLAAIISALSSILGLYISYYLNIASGAAIVLTCTVVFLITWGLQSFRQSQLKPKLENV